MTPDGTSRVEIDHSRPELAIGRAGGRAADIGVQTAALSESGGPVVMEPPQAGQKVEIDLDHHAALRLAFDFKGATVDAIDGKIFVTLPNGGVVVLSGELVTQFLAGGDASLEQILATAAGGAASPEGGEQAGSESATFHHADPTVPVGTGLAQAGVLGGTALSYGFPANGEIHEDSHPGTLQSATPTNTPPVALGDGFGVRGAERRRQKRPGVL